MLDPIPPQLFQGIIGPGRWGKDVDDKVPIIHKDPFRMFFALDTQWARIVLLQFEFHAFVNRLVLSVRVAVHDDEVVRKRGYAPQVDDEDVLGLLVFGRIDTELDLGG